MSVSRRNLLIEYIRVNIKIFASGIICLCICGIIFYLYQLPTGAVGYAALLCSVLICGLAIPDFMKFCKKHRELACLLHPDNLELNPFPPAASLHEKDYQDIIQRLYENQASLLADQEKSRTEMMDYYTMWVHQIKTPISAMNLLIKSEDTPENAAIGAELFKIEQYVEMVLSYLRLDSSATDFVITRCSLAKIVREAIRKYARLFVLKKIRLVFDEEDLEVLTDEKWLGFVIEQLISNAIKYTQKGQITIRFDRPASALEITDTGIGIHAEDLPRVFDKGFTGYNGRSGQKSSGLGLYLSRRILNKLSHTIDITSVPGQGTTVRIGLDIYPIR